jgi:hypothetical protein
MEIQSAFTLEPVDNAFNGTNSFTGSTLYNMDLDVYTIQNILHWRYFGADPTDLRPRFCNDQCHCHQIKQPITDATLINDIALLCNSRKITIDYSVYNTNSTAIVPAATPIAIYANGLLIGTTKTLNTIPIDGEENSKITLDIPK